MSAGVARLSRRTAATREKLYVAAIDLFGEHGIDQVSVDTIAGAAGVAKGTVYYNFGSKEELVTGLIEDRVSTLITLIEATTATLSGTGTDALIDTLLSFVEEHTRFVQLLVGELWRPSSRWRDELYAVRERVIGAIEPLLIDASPRPDAPLRTTAGGILVTTLGIGLDWIVYTPTRPRAEVADHLRLLFNT